MSSSIKGCSSGIIEGSRVESFVIVIWALLWCLTCWLIQHRGSLNQEGLRLVAFFTKWLYFYLPVTYYQIVYYQICTLLIIKNNDDVVLQFNGQTNQAISSIQCGGVGRNLSDGLSRLGSQPRFLTALGRDVGGDSIISKCPHMVCRILLNHLRLQSAILFSYQFLSLLP